MPLTPKLIDNSMGAKYLRISSQSNYDFGRNLVKVILLDAVNTTEILGEFYSTIIIVDNDQPEPYSFDISIPTGVFIVHLRLSINNRDELSDPTFELMFE